MDVGYRIDLFVEREIIVDLKAVEKMIPLYDAQLLSYLKLSGKKIGLLINFNVVLLKDGIKRMANRVAGTWVSGLGLTTETRRDTEIN